MTIIAPKGDRLGRDVIDEKKTVWCFEPTSSAGAATFSKSMWISGDGLWLVGLRGQLQVWSARARAFLGH